MYIYIYMRKHETYCKGNYGGRSYIDNRYVLGKFFFQVKYSQNCKKIPNEILVLSPRIDTSYAVRDTP